MSKTGFKTYTLEDVSKHTKAKDCWIIHDNKVYCMNKFLDDHPGGSGYILTHSGKDITSLMADKGEHSHSSASYELMQEYQVGIIGAEESIVNPDFVMTDHFVPSDTQIGEDYKKNKFLDLNKPLLEQIWYSNFSKSFYLQQVHQPRHLSYSAKLFSQPYLEMFTLTPWWVVPMVWFPIACFMFYKSIVGQVDATTFGAASVTMSCFSAGIVLWSILEYVFHRFLFHVDGALPDRPAFLMLHFLLHGIHHFLPMDKMRLVMPPLLFTLLSTPFVKLAHTIFPSHIANGIISGAFVAYVAYDTNHWAMHHTQLPGWLRTMKKHHMEHHYQNPDLGFGVSLKLWDWVFGTDFIH